MLETRDASNMKRDILLSMALAKLGQAEYYFSNSNQVRRAEWGSFQGSDVGGDGLYMYGSCPAAAKRWRIATTRTRTVKRNRRCT